MLKGTVIAEHVVHTFNTSRHISVFEANLVYT